MCGISGILSLKKEEKITPAMIAPMCAVMRHRGPDEEGIHCQGPIGLGMRRLKIIDLDSGRQPIFNEDGSVCVVFNGEIYNYKKLREDLIKKGHFFKTQSDTEVLVHLYEEEGEDFLCSLNGMFAIALWDQKREKLILARDRFGEKPLHYLYSSKRLTFSSELKSMLTSLPERPQLDSEAVYQYFLSHYIPAPLTIYQGIKKLLPGHYLRIVKGEISEIKYWDFTYEPDYTMGESYISERIYDLLEDSVRLRLVSDVPLGAFLSGGVDSSVIVGLMSHLMDQPVQTFSIGFKEEKYDESRFALEVSRSFGTEHKEQIVEASAVGLINDLVWHFDEPFGDSSAIPTYLLSKMTRQNVKVALSGDGGDELFAGYNRYVRMDGRKKWNLLPRPLLKQLSTIGRILPKDTRGKAFLQSLDIEDYPFFCFGSEPMQLEGLLSEEFKEEVKTLNPYRFSERYFLDLGRREYIAPFMYFDAKVYFPDDILVKVDRMSMAHSLETRVPFLDHRLVEFVATIPANLKLRKSLGGKIGKYILKRAFKKLLPEVIQKRPKQGFTLPVALWFRDELREMALDVLSESHVKRMGILNPQAVSRMLNEHIQGNANHKRKLWACFVFVLWYQSWIESKQTEECNRFNSVGLGHL